ncbi:MAG TPA: TolC family protein [Kofleriaceae bacterium]|nr:TolC family protein [Kofleriaceae bacterium]
MRCAGVFAVLLAAGTARADEPARKLSLHEAIDVSLSENPDIAIAKETVRGAGARVSGAKAHALPLLTVDSAASYYRHSYSLEFGSLGSFTLHQQQVSATNVTLAQPLTGLAYLSELVGSAQQDADATRADYDKTRLDTAYRTADAYLRVLEARATADLAHRSVADIQSELDRAIQLRQAETYTDIDVLRFRSAKAAADRDALRADTTAAQALARLAVQLGLHDGAAIDVADDLPETPPQIAMTLDAALTRALSARPELHAARDRIDSANHARRAAREKYLPNISAVGVWTHLTGVQPFQPEDEEYLGLRIQWNIWDWGATHDAVTDAEVTQNRAMLSANALVDQVRLDVRQRWLDARAAFDSLPAARTQQQAAEEALRLQKVRFEAGAATTTDVLDSETDARRARLVFAVARYDYYLSLVALARAMGDLPASTP